ncbi:hypothetical protein J2Z32_000874 [Paenibacillus turicensis]|uniref:PKD/Chitinase domain-containing protein n=2 Tax=Paenibacillus turicensis TaxID=160487 RepID=A0ABS4FNV1_9BACL|nr:hypothetical protein [Paenibacillus turicensis]
MNFQIKNFVVKLLAFVMVFALIMPQTLAFADQSIDSTKKQEDTTNTSNEGTSSDSATKEGTTVEQNSDPTTPVDPTKSVDSTTPVDSTNDVTEEGKPSTEATPTTEQNATTEGDGLLVLYMNSAKMEQNGQVYQSTSPMTVKKGVSYVGVRSLTNQIGYQFTYLPETKEFVITYEGHELKFKVNTTEYMVDGVQQTMRGAVYQEKNVTMVPLTAIMTALNIPYTVEGKKVILQLKTAEEEPVPEPIPPVALFTTDKAEYKIGEKIYVSDQSTPGNSEIVSRKWSENWQSQRPAFFSAGPKSITLTVTDKNGLTSEYTVTINISNEVLYTEAQFNMLFTEVGQKFPLGEKSVLSFDRVPFTFTPEPYTLFRSSGPETVTTEGILYSDIIQGNTRFMIHHGNKIGEKAKLYVIAQNDNMTETTISTESYGVAGPSEHPDITGRVSFQRYLENSLTGSKKNNTTLLPGESKLILTDLSASIMGQGQVLSLFGDVYSDNPIKYTVVIVKAGSDPLQALATLPNLDPKESIVRGTFTDSTKVFRYTELLGAKDQRLPLTDNSFDLFQQGYDGIMGTSAINSGNYGVLYKLQLERVAPNTLITFNPRGGLFLGAAMVNGKVVSFSHSDATPTTSASVLYRTGSSEEKVEIILTPSAGSNMPFNLLFMPMPQKKN